MQLFKKEQLELTEENIPFYAHIGLVTVRFAELESLISHIIERLINSDDDVISNTLIENNNLSSNLNVLEKINRRRGYEEKKITEVIKKINQLKKTRNFFVHGVWNDIKKDEKGIYMRCSNHKHIYKKIHNGKQWTRYSGKIFRLEDLQNEIKNIDAILIILKEIFENLEEINFHYQ